MPLVRPGVAPTRGNDGRRTAPEALVFGPPPARAWGRRAGTATFLRTCDGEPARGRHGGRQRRDRARGHARGRRDRQRRGPVGGGCRPGACCRRRRRPSCGHRHARGLRTRVCGACTVLVDGEPVRSCPTFGWSWSTARRSPPSRAWPAPRRAWSPVQRAFRECHGLRCGFCTPGFLLLATGARSPATPLPVTTRSPRRWAATRAAAPATSTSCARCAGRPSWWPRPSPRA